MGVFPGSTFQPVESTLTACACGESCFVKREKRQLALVELLRIIRLTISLHMEIPTTSYKEWVALNRNEISESYREYVHDALDDSGFDITMLEDFYTWAKVEYECLTRNA